MVVKQLIAEESLAGREERGVQLGSFSLGMLSRLKFLRKREQTVGKFCGMVVFSVDEDGLALWSLGGLWELSEGCATLSRIVTHTPKS